MLIELSNNLSKPYCFDTGCDYKIVIGNSPSDFFQVLDYIDIS